MRESNSSPPTIMPLSIHDAEEYVAHIVRNIATSGVGDTPIFSARSHRTRFDEKGMLGRMRESWTRPIDQHGWERAWGLVQTDPFSRRSIVGAASLTSSRGLETQLHRATVGLGIESRHRGYGH